MDKIGLRLGSVYLLKFRRIRHGGSPSIPSVISSDSDRADSIVWSDFLFGNWSATQQIQTSVSTGTVSGTSGISQSTQGQTASASGTAPPFSRLQSATGHGFALQSVYAIKAYPYRRTWIIAKPTDGSASRGWIWHDWFFGIASKSDQGGQLSIAAGTVGGAAGVSASAQGSQNAAATGDVSGVAGVSSSTQGSQTAAAAGDEIFYSGTLVVGGVASGGATIRVYDAVSGEAFWTADHGGTVRCVAVDDSGNVYVGGDAGTGGYTLRKYGPGGTVAWSVDTGTTVFGLAIDSSGNVYIGGVAVSGYTTRKYNSSGTEIVSGGWPANHGDAAVLGIATDANNNVYTVGGRNSSNLTTRAYSASGSLLWSHDHTATAYAAASIDGSGVIATVGAQGLYPNYYSTDILAVADGSASYQYNHGATVWSVAAGRDTVGAIDNRLLLAIGDTLKSCDYNALGTFHWTASHGDTLFGVAVSRHDGSVYVVGNRASSITTRKYQRDGTEITTGWRLDHGDSLYAVAWSPYHRLPAVQAPSLPLGIALGLPTTANVIAVPSLSLRIALGIPTVTDTSLPPDVVVLALQSVYRLYVSGGLLLELPFARLQCQRRLGESTWITAIVPTCSTALLTDLANRKASDGRIIVYSGVRLSDGTEQTGQFLQAVLTEIEGERAGRSGTIRLQGRLVPTYFTAQSRTLYGISQRGKAEDGTYWAHCAADPLLHPNDTVNDGAQSWAVKSILYEIAPRQNSMSITST